MFPVSVLRKSVEDGPSVRAPAIHMRWILDGIPDSWLWLGQALSCFASLMGGLSLSLSITGFQLNLKGQRSMQRLIPWSVVPAS